MLCCAARTGALRKPWATAASSASGSSLATKNGMKAATPNAAVAASRIPTACVTEPPGSSAKTSGSGRDVTSPPDPVPTAAAAATDSATAIASLARISPHRSLRSFWPTPLRAGQSWAANTSGASATTM